MSFLRVFFGFSLIALSHIASAGEYRPLTDADRSATQDAFAASMRTTDFAIAARAGDAEIMKSILVENGAPASIDLIAQGISIQSSSGDPVPAETPNNGGICARWKLVTWYAEYSSPGHPAGWYSIWVCTMYISDGGVITYDSPL